MNGTSRYGPGWDDLSVEEQLAAGFDQEWWSPGVLKPPRALTYPEITAWRAARVAEGAVVLTEDEWKAIHGR